MERKTNWLAIVACVVAGMVLGFLWYGMLFLDTWAAGNGFTMDKEAHKMFRDGVEVSGDNSAMIFNTGAMFIYALILNWLLGRTNSNTRADGATVGAAIGLIGAIGVFISDKFSMSPTSLSMVDGSYVLVLFTVMGAILGGWLKK